MKVQVRGMLGTKAEKQESDGLRRIMSSISWIASRVSSGERARAKFGRQAGTTPKCLGKTGWGVWP